ncbi:MAG: hypothetical protein K2Q21_05695 [Chitinophagaceae bacterium]|nr:hypothetical protein [Chitinophagaceae bacterium]
MSGLWLNGDRICISSFFVLSQQMLSNDTRSKIKNITAGNVIEGSTDTCTAIRNYLCTGFPTSTTVKTDFEGKLLVKKEQVRFLEIYSKKNNLWLTALPVQDTFLLGAEKHWYIWIQTGAM